MKNYGITFLLIICLCFGFLLSLRKTLWNDELYTQVYTIQKCSYAQILKGEFKEGINSPLYYFIQKIVLDLTHYRLPYEWRSIDDGRIYEPRSQWLLRLTNNIFISLAIVWIVRYSTIHFGWG